MITETIWKYFQEEIKLSTEHESSRQKITSIILTISGVLLSIIGYDKKLNISDLILTISLIFLGLFGMLFNQKYYERYNFHYERARKYREYLENELKDKKLGMLRKEAGEINSKKFPKISKIRLHFLWAVLNLIISFLGILLTVIALY